MQTFNSLAFAACMALLGIIMPMSGRAAEVMNNPDPTSVTLLQYKYSKVAPPYATLAACEESVKSADEFHKDAALKLAQARLAGRFAEMQDTVKLIINLSSSFSEYDSDHGEYDLDINDGTVISAYNACSKEVRIALTNGTNAQTWKLDPAEAQRVLEKNRNIRNVIAILKLTLLPSSQAVDGEPAVLNAKVVGYDVLSLMGDRKLGAVAVQ